MKKSNYFIKSIIILSFFTLIFSGCSFSTHFIQTGSKIYPETEPSTVKIYSGEPKEEYIVIGSIAVDYMGSNENGVEYLKEKAALLGANAVIFTKLSSVITTRQSLNANGVAVRFKK